MIEKQEVVEVCAVCGLVQSRHAHSYTPRIKPVSCVCSTMWKVFVVPAVCSSYKHEGNPRDASRTSPCVVCGHKEKCH